MDLIPFILIFLCVRIESIHGRESRKDNPAVDPTHVTQISWSPRAFLYTGFLSDEECDHLISLAKDKLQKSMVADENGEDVESQERTSTGMFLQMAQDEIVSGVEAKIAAWTFLPQEWGGYADFALRVRQEYVPHYDYFYDEVNLKLGGHRVATVLMYLSNVKKGGETVFPLSEVKGRQPNGDERSDCAKQGYSVKPRKGDALLFFNLHLNATTDASTLHGSCPVIDGEKWSATKWLHVRAFDGSSRPISGCVDENLNCLAWADLGECETNPGYMVGSEQEPGYCRKSCKACSS